MFNVRMLLLASMLMSTFAVNAQSTTPAPPPKNANPEKFAEHKQKDLARIAQHLQGMQALQSCVQAANDHAALKACHETARAAMKKAQ